MRAIEKHLRERIKSLETQKEEVEADRRLFRDHFIRRFKWWTELLGKGHNPSAARLIEADAKELQNFKWWYW